MRAVPAGITRVLFPAPSSERDALLPVLEISEKSSRSPKSVGPIIDTNVEPLDHTADGIFGRDRGFTAT